MADQATLLDHSEEGRRLDQPDHAAEHARLSIAHARKQKRARHGAVSQAALAVSHLQRDDLEAAHAACVRTLSLTKQVQSSGAVEAVQDLQRRMKPFGNHRLVVDFAERARELTAAARGGTAAGCLGQVAACGVPLRR